MCIKSNPLENIMFRFIYGYYDYEIVGTISYHTLFKGTNDRQKTCEIFHVYCIFYSGFMCQTTVIFGIKKDGSLVSNPLAS